DRGDFGSGPKRKNEPRRPGANQQQIGALKRETATDLSPVEVFPRPFSGVSTAPAALNNVSPAASEPDRVIQRPGAGAGLPSEYRSGVSDPQPSGQKN